jgi:hypothetical protein
MTRSREWLLLNAVETWLFHYGKSGTPSTVEQYKDLQTEFHDAYMATITVDLELPPVEDEEPTPTPTPTRTTRKRTTK